MAGGTAGSREEVFMEKSQWKRTRTGEGRGGVVWPLWEAKTVVSSQIPEMRRGASLLLKVDVRGVLEKNKGQREICHGTKGKKKDGSPDS